MSFSRNIFQAARDAQISEVEKYLKNGFPIDSRDHRGKTPLCWALERSPLGVTPDVMVRYLISRGANVNVKDKDGLTPLYRATLLNSASIAETLIRAGACQELPSAILAEDKVFFDEYINSSNDLNSKIGHYTPLQWVAYKSDSICMASKLIDKGIEINSREPLQGRTALHLAALCDNQFVAQQLLSSGADPNIRDFQGKIPLHMAVDRNHLCIVRLLVDSGSEINLGSGFWGLTPLYFAKSLEVRNYLKSQGADREMPLWTRLLFFMGSSLKEFVIQQSGQF